MLKKKKEKKSRNDVVITEKFTVKELVGFIKITKIWKSNIRLMSFSKRNQHQQGRDSAKSIIIRTREAPQTTLEKLWKVSRLNFAKFL